MEKTRVRGGSLISLNVEQFAHNQDFLGALESFIDAYKRKANKAEPVIPVSLFAHRELGVLEVVVKCLRENYSMNHTTIAKILNRNDRTIWSTYNNAKNKYMDMFILEEGMPMIPVSIFSNRSLGPLEILTVYAKEKLHLTYNEICLTLNRHYPTVWLSYRNGAQKRGNKNRKTTLN